MVSNVVDFIELLKCSLKGGVGVCVVDLCEVCDEVEDEVVLLLLLWSGVCCKLVVKFVLKGVVMKIVVKWIVVKCGVVSDFVVKKIVMCCKYVV